LIANFLGRVTQVPGWSWTTSNKRIENVNAENKKENYQ
jgi:hypothetical protein